MKHLSNFLQDLYELRFSPMCKPAAEVANLTHWESFTTRSRCMMLWSIAQGYNQWGSREVELLYQSTLDSISEAFDVFHHPISKLMAAARADVWEMKIAPDSVQAAVDRSLLVHSGDSDKAPSIQRGESLLLAGEIAELNDKSLLSPLIQALRVAGVKVSPWIVQSGSVAYSLGAWEVARKLAEKVAGGLRSISVQTVIADGPETAWMLRKIYPELGVKLPEDMVITLLSEKLTAGVKAKRQNLGKVFIHDSRAACLIADRMPDSRVILPGYSTLASQLGMEVEEAFGKGVVYSAPRDLLDAMGAERVFGTWTRALARTSGADDALWLTYPDLAAGLAKQLLDYAERLGVDKLITDSPLAVAHLHKQNIGRKIEIKLLAETICSGETA